MFVAVAFCCAGRGMGQSFAAPVVLPTPDRTGQPSSPVQLLAGDLQGLGRSDFFYTTLTPNTSLAGLELLNDGKGNFSAATQNSVGFADGSVGQIALGDYDGDGLIDYGFIVSTQGVAGTGTLAVYYGAGGGAFNLQETVGFTFPTLGRLAPTFTSLQTIRFAKDGVPGLVAVDSSNGFLYVFVNSGKHVAAASSFTLLTQYAIPEADGGGPITVADLNGDGTLDVVVNGQAEKSVSVYLGNGDGTFQAPLRFTTTGGVISLLLADVNNDGKLDLIAEETSGQIEVFAGNGDGTFGSSSIGGTTSADSSKGDGGQLIAAVDLNGDKILDLLTYTPSGVSVELGTKSGAYTLAGIYATGTVSRTSFAIGDFNGDGLLDVAVNAPAGIVVLDGVRALATPGTVSATPAPAAFEGAYSLVAKMNGGQTSGTVNFTLDGNAAGSAPVVNGLATLAVAADPASANGKPLLPGTHALGGTYFASASALAAELMGGTLVVSLAPSTVTLTPAPPTVTLGPTYFYGQGVNGYVHFNVVDPSNYAATGTWTQLSNGVAVPGCVGLSAANASSYCPYGYPTLLDAGNYVFTEAYNGGPANGDPVNASSVSAPYGFTVMPDVTTVAGLTSSMNPAGVGTPVTFTATLTGNAAVPQGMVEFLDGGGMIGMGALDASGVATLTTSTLALGTHPISVKYAATLDFEAAASGILDQKIVPVVSNLASATVLQSSLNPSAKGQTVTFTATVSVPGPFVNLVNSGTVSFLDGTAVIGSGTIHATGRAVFSTAALAVGSHPITATYAGLVGTTQTTLPSVSSVLTQVVGMTLPVEPEGFVLTVTPNPVQVRPGQTVYLTVKVRAVSGFAEPVTLSCGKLPYETKCTFAEGTIPIGGGETTLAFATTAPHACGSNKGYDGTPVACALPAPAMTGRGMVGGVLFGGVVMLLGFRRRRMVRVFGAVLLLMGSNGLNGCGGNCTNLGTEPGGYTVQVTGTAIPFKVATDAPQVETVNLPVTVGFP